MRMENQIHDIITGKLVLNGIDNTNEFINKVNEIGKQLYEKCKEDKKDEFLRDFCAYIMAKALEQVTLVKLREKPYSWFVVDEMLEGAVFNLPSHIEERMYDYMDAADKALELYLKGKKQVQLLTLLTRIQNIGAYFAARDKLFEIGISDLSAKEVMTRDEMYNFAINTTNKHLENQGFKVEKVLYGYGNPVNLIAVKEGKTYHISIVANIAPNESELEGWRLKAALNSIKNTDKILAKVNVLFRSKEEKYHGIAVAKGEYEVKITPVQVFNENPSERVS